MASSPTSSPLSLTLHGLPSRISSFRLNLGFFPRPENAQQKSPIVRPVIAARSEPVRESRPVIAARSEPVRESRPVIAARSEPVRESNGRSVPSSRDGSDVGSSPVFTNLTSMSSETRTLGSATAARQDAAVPRSGSDPVDRDLERGTTGGNPRTVAQALDFTHSIISAAATCLGTAVSITLLVANKGGLPKAVFATGASGTVLSLGAAVSGLVYGCCYREEPAASTWMKRIAYSALCLSMLSTVGLGCASVVVN